MTDTPERSRDSFVLAVFGFFVGAVCGALALIVWRWTGAELGIQSIAYIGWGALAVGAACGAAGLVPSTPRILRSIASFALVFSFPALMISVVLFGWLVKERLMNIENRAGPLIEAIKTYAKEQGHAPVELAVLAPKYIPAIPETKELDQPQFEYSPNVDGEWQLRVVCGFMHGQEFLYRPSEKYVQLTGSIVRVGRWARVRE